jgi:hypothetical protein
MPQHGTRSNYTTGCRCQPCTEANRTYARNLDRHKSRVRYGIEQPIERFCDPTEAQNHLEWLRTNGIGLRTVTNTTGLSRKTLFEIRRRTVTRILITTHNKILSVGLHRAPNASLIPADQTWRLVNELLDEGWTGGRINRAIGNNSYALQLGKIRVQRSTAKKIEELHRTIMLPKIVDRENNAERQRQHRNNKTTI